MKVLRCNLRFVMPDDWNGSAADALREAAAFLDDETAGLDSLPDVASHGESHSAFFINLQQGMKFSGEVSVYEAESPRWHWQRIDIGRMPRVHMDKDWMVK